jgi:hypothetical protein
MALLAKIACSRDNFWEGEFHSTRIAAAESLSFAVMR